MEANAKFHEITGGTTYYCVTVEVKDGMTTHELDVVIEDTYYPSSETYESSHRGTEWVTPPPDNSEKQDSIVAAAKRAAEQYIENL